MIIATLILIMILLVVLAYHISRLNNEIEFLDHLVRQNRKEIRQINGGPQLKIRGCDGLASNDTLRITIDITERGEKSK